MTLSIVLSSTSGTPIYAQIERQISAAILRGDLAEGEALPSIRTLARDLRVSVITTTRAYSDLANDGFVTNVPGRGSFVRRPDAALVRHQMEAEIDGLFAEAARLALLAEIPSADLHARLTTALTTPEE
ncbi:MAG: GntR family transcriptional regulator [Propionibacteriaceae bacterium]|nr:GntR family transcriptional regulator [Micropruina sp.]HBX82230.1 GntR family transcriptional regulator [Propionibacteriaceae bacterium]HBY22445.1 GntR family transcriptional regulator [Propionibacteriaceae bacterium]